MDLAGIITDSPKKRNERSGWTWLMLGSAHQHFHALCEIFADRLAGLEAEGWQTIWLPGLIQDSC